MEPQDSRRRRDTLAGIRAALALFLALTLIISSSEAQIVSHALRKLAVSTNQFGIDALRALDRLEPADRVIVFSPVCLTASLSMVMMGSSKYQVVSALRHALYVWSMKPREINQAYRDIFDHIGLNQAQQSVSKHPKSSNQTANQDLVGKSSLNDAKESQSWWNRAKVNENDQDHGWESGARRYHLSLPGLVRMRERLDRSSPDATHSWWSKDSHKLAGPKIERKTTPNVGADDSIELSQMNTLSGIYIQRGLNMNYNYNLLLRDYYRTVVHPVDLVRNGEETRQHINSLVALNTEGKIRDLMKKQTFEGKQIPKALIVSAFHFRGTLDIQMKAKPAVAAAAAASSNRIRRQDSGPHDLKNTQAVDGARNSSNAANQLADQRIYIETEPTLLKFGQFKSLDCSAIEIPFNNRLISLIIVMPNHRNSTDMLLTKLSAQVLNDMLNSLSVKKISLEIPVIKFGRGPTNVAGLMRELSLNETFFGQTSQFTTETGLNRWLRPQDIVHETSIDVGTINPAWSQTEDRLKVGAHSEASRLVMLDRTKGFKAGRSRDQVDHLRLDKPFFYFISDSINNLVLTMGRVRQ